MINEKATLSEILFYCLIEGVPVAILQKSEIWYFLACAFLSGHKLGLACLGISYLIHPFSRDLKVEHRVEAKWLLLARGALLSMNQTGCCGWQPGNEAFGREARGPSRGLIKDLPARGTGAPNPRNWVFHKCIC